MLSESIVAPPSPSRALVAVLATDVVRAKPFSPFLVSHAGRCSSFEGRSFSVSAGPSVASHWSRCPFPGRLQVMPAPCRRCSSFGFCLIHEVARPRISKGLVSDGGSSGVGPHAVSCFMPEGPALSTSPCNCAECALCVGNEGTTALAREQRLAPCRIEAELVGERF